MYAYKYQNDPTKWGTTWLGRCRFQITSYNWFPWGQHTKKKKSLKSFQHSVLLSRRLWDGKLGLLIICVITLTVQASARHLKNTIRDYECDFFFPVLFTSPVGYLSSFLCGKDWIMSANLTTSCHYSLSKKSL